jgi:carbon starvation protein
MAFSTFVFDTLDVSMRLGRYIVQDLLGWKGRIGALAGTLLTMGLPAYFIMFAPPNSWTKFWTLFGASNQLLAALTLLTITVWLYKARHRIAFTLIPMIFVLVITLWALVSLVIGNLRLTRIGTGLVDIELMNGLAAAALVLLALYLAALALFRIRSERQQGSLTAPHAAASLE